jgi:hypothetical protein
MNIIMRLKIADKCIIFNIKERQAYFFSWLWLLNATDEKCI